MTAAVAYLAINYLRLQHGGRADRERFVSELQVHRPGSQ